MTIVDVLVLLIAALALGGWSFSLTTQERNIAELMKSFLPQAQGLQALAKLKDTEDEKLRSILSKFDKKADQAPNLQKALDEIKRKAEQAGFTINTAPQQKGDSVMTPPPEIDLDPNMPFVE